MFVDRDVAAAEPTSQERRDDHQQDKRVLGYVVQCDGARAVLSAYADNDPENVGGRWTVGKLISINLGTTRTVGLVYEIGKPDRSWDAAKSNAIEVGVELVGEVRDAGNGSKPVFDRGVTQYPYIGAVAHRIRARDLQAVYDLAGRRSITIGSLAQDSSIDANIAIDETLNRHFAFVGTTGVGKSTAVTLLMRKAIAARPDLRVIMLDPHNEFASALSEHCIRIDATTLELPFWMFRLEELAEVLFRGREIVPEEVDLLRDVIPIAKQMYRNGPGAISRRNDGTTADTPIPYKMADVLKLVDERMGLLDGKSERPFYRSLKVRIEGAVNDPRYRFMFASKMIEDTIHQTIGHIFRVLPEGKPITCFEMAGMPSEVVNSVCSVLARMAFDLAVWSEGKLKLLLMCEEAHRYMPSDTKQGFAPTRHALSRIAKEGRKYGCYLGIITQRPGELDPTILSQCSTVFAMRLANEQDQSIIRSAIADSSASSLSFLSSMGQREAIAFGEGVATTMRLKFESIPQSQIPGLVRAKEPVEDAGGQVDLFSIVDRMRNAQIATVAAAEPETATPSASNARPGQDSSRSSIEVGLRRLRPTLSDDDPNFGYGQRASIFGGKSSRD